MLIDFHADDLGATQNVNDNILSLWHEDVLKGASIIANGDAMEHLASELKSNNLPLRLSIHLNLSEGLALGDHLKLNKLVDEEGYFRYGFIGIYNLWLRSNRTERGLLLEQIELEWREQIRRVVNMLYPRKVSALDGHIHIHMLPFLFPIAVKLATEFDLPEIRISRELYHISLKDSISLRFAVNNFKHAILNEFSRQNRKLADKAGLSYPEAVAGILYTGRMSYETTLAAINAALASRIKWLEIIFHPGRARPEEINRWSKRQRSIAKFYSSINRDFEKSVLLRLKHISS